MGIDMRIKTQLPWIFLLVLTACSTQSARLPTVPPLSTPTILVLSPSATAFATPIPSPILTPTPTAIKPPALEDIKWSTYEFPVGVSFEYPSDWFMVHNQEYFVEFTFPYFPWSVSTYIFDRPLKDKAIADPHTWNSNEGVYELLWERPISIENADGFEVIYGTPSDNQVSGLLIANYYSEKHALEVRFYGHADMIPTGSDKYDIFEHIIQSVQIAP